MLSVSANLTKALCKYKRLDIQLLVEWTYISEGLSGTPCHRRAFVSTGGAKYFDTPLTSVLI